MKAKATVCLNLDSERKLQAILNSLKPETVNLTTTRSRVSFRHEGTRLFLRIEAKDTVALRAASNAYLRWIDSVVNVLGVLETTSSRSQPL